ncbi:MAG: 6-bladed beta-propeller [Lysobacteraceae bacterium]|nr:MAG: 6-bladed beta-propeller [Xanthomonadaceae bacterium]
MNTMLIRLCLTTAAVAAAGAAMAGKIAEPDELRYPNVIAPRLQISSDAYDSKGLLGNIESVIFLDENRFLVSASTAPQFAIFEAESGRLLREKRFEGPGYRIRGVAYAHDADTLYAVESSRGQLFAISQDLEIRRTYPLPVRNPADVAVSQGKAYITDESAGTLLIMDLDSGAVEKRQVAAEGKPLLIAQGIVAHGDYVAIADAGNDRLVAGDLAQGTFFSIGKGWGSYGGQLATPIDLSLADGKLYVADQINHRVQVFTDKGEFVFQWARHPPTAHEGNGRVHYPSAIGVSPSGRETVVCEPIENRCQIFSLGSVQARVVDTNESSWWEKATRFHYGKRVATAGDILAISEPDTHSVLVFTLPEPGAVMRPEFLTRIGGRGSEPGRLIQPSGLLIDPETSTIMVSDRGNLRMQKFAFERGLRPAPVAVGKPTPQMGTGASKFMQAVSFRRSEGVLTAKNEPLVGEPSAMAKLPDGRILLLDPAFGRVHIADANMRIRQSWGEQGHGATQLIKPLDLDISPDGKRVYVVDEYAFMVKVFTPEGRFLFSWGGPGDRDDQFVTPFGIAVAPNGDVFVSDTATNSIRKFSADGQFLNRWGGWGIGPGEFYKPKGLSIDRHGRLFVMDFGNHRGQVFDLNGKFISMFGISDKSDEIELK